MFYFDVRTASSVNVQTLVDTTMHHCKDISSPSQKFRQLNVDIAGLLPNSNGYTYILVLVDRLSRWPVAVQMKDSRTQTIINALMHNWISLYEVPETTTSDRGSQFLSQGRKDVLKFLGIRHTDTTAYHLKVMA